MRSWTAQKRAKKSTAVVVVGDFGAREVGECQLLAGTTEASVLVYGRRVPGEVSPGDDRICAADVMATLSLATDLGHGSDFEHGLRSTLFAMRLAQRLDVDQQTASETYYASLLLYIGCTADAHRGAEVFGDSFETLGTYTAPVEYGSPRESFGGLLAGIAPGRAPAVRAAAIARTLPKAARAKPHVFAATCEVACMLSDRLGLPSTVSVLFAHLFARWDGKGEVGDAKGEEIPLPIRIAHVAHDADVQRELGGAEHAADVIRARAGGAFDPAIVARLVEDAPEILALDDDTSAWNAVLASEPGPRLTLEGEAIDRALAAMGDFADLPSPYLVGNSAAVARLASEASRRYGLEATEAIALRRAALVHDLGRVAVPVRIWQKPGPLTPGEWEKVRLHPYHSERVLCHAPVLAAIAPVASAHHERLDGSGYHRGAVSSSLTRPARLLAAADAYHAMTQPRPHREAMAPVQAATTLGAEANAGLLDADAVAAVIEAAGQPAPRLERPAGLTEREAEVVGLLARGLQTKQVARQLGISVKTADRHVQNAYGKIGVSTRAGATLFAMEHGLTGWEDRR